MKKRLPGTLFATILLLLGIFFPMVPATRVESKEPVVHSAWDANLLKVQDSPRQEKIQTSEKGLEKLSPDLRALLAAQPVAVQGAASPAAAGVSVAEDPVSGDPLLVSAMIQPGADVKRFFTRSVTGRTVGGVAWVTGEISPLQLRKLVSVSEVLGVISNNTYLPAEAPGLEDLRSIPKRPNIKQARAFLTAGEPEMLREQLLQMQSASGMHGRPGEPPADPLYSPSEESQFAMAVPGPNLLDVHDVRRAREEGFSGEGVVVGIVDTGVDFSHPDLVGTQAVIKSGPYAGWPFAYDTLSGYQYALDTNATIDPDNFLNMVGKTNYVHTLPVQQPTCAASRCTATLLITTDTDDEITASFTWPDTSKSKNYFYSIYPDLSLIYLAYYLNMSYSQGWILPPIVIVSDEQSPGVYDTVYVDINYDYNLSLENERMTRDHPVVGVDLDSGNGTGGIWDLSAGMLSWISDGFHHPPGVEVLYPEISQELAPGAGRLLAFVNDQHGHGTSCASMVAGQGKIMDPHGLGPSNPLYAGGAEAGGVGGAVIASMAVDAKIAGFQNGFDMPFNSWILAAYGMDGLPNTGDEANIVSNSWGDSNVIADGWDPVSRFAQQLLYTEAPAITYLVATGNGGHGYGTRTSPGGGPIIDVGASTAYGGLKVFEYVDTSQFLFGEIQPWSNRGPGSLGDIAPDIVAVGAWGAAAVPLNSGVGDGERAYDVFGGTSMSAPIAAGSLAMIYQAFRSSHDRWPTWEEARNILLGSTVDLGYDVLTQGAGNLQASRAVDIAMNREPGIAPSQWQAGRYRGTRYPAFPAILHPGEQDTQTFTVMNPAAEPVSVKLKSAVLQNIHEETFTFAFSTPPPDTDKFLPIFLKEITGLIGQYNPDLVRAQVVFPYSKFDVDDNGYADNWWTVNFYDWMDRNGDQNLWTDRNYDGRVDQDEIDIDPTTGLYEYNRFTYDEPQSNYLEASLGGQGLALAERHNGVFLGLYCYFCSESTSLQVRVAFYQKVPWNWLELSAAEIQVPSSGEGEFAAALTVPAETLPGSYEGSIEVSIDGKKTVLPVIANVAANSTTFRFGGPENSGLSYDNAHMFGGYNWRWRYEAGDWRIYYNDIPDGTEAEGKSMVVDTHWGAPATDLDTWLLGPVDSVYSQTHPDIFGPNDLEISGGSIDEYTTYGRFRWMTNTGYSREVVAAPVQDGLNMIALHNVLNSGLQFAEEYLGSVYQLTSNPGKALIISSVQGKQPPYLSGSQQFSFTSTADIQEGIQIQAFGMSAPVDLPGQQALQDSPTNICSASWVYKRSEGGLEIRNGGSLEITTTTTTAYMDLDLLLFRDNGDKRWNCNQENLITYSINADSSERIKILFPEDGTYWVAVHGVKVPVSQNTFDIQIRSIAGADLTLVNGPVGSIYANQPVDFTVNYRGSYTSNRPTVLEGFLLIGIPSVQDLLEIPIQAQPDILIYPAPLLFAEVPWVARESVGFSLTIQNQGVNTETIQADIQLPDGLVIEPGSITIDVSGDSPTFDPVSHSIRWKGPLEGGKTATIHFRASGQPGFQPAMGEITALVRGETSGQEWSVKTPVWINQYGLLFPFIRR